LEVTASAKASASKANHPLDESSVTDILDQPSSRMWRRVLAKKSLKLAGDSNFF